MYKHNILFIGLDTHKVSTEVAHVEDQRGANPVHYGKIKTTKAAVDGVGAAIGSYPLVIDDLKRGSSIAPFGFVLSGNSYILLGQESRSDNDLEKQFIDWIKNQLLQCVPTNEEVFPV